METLRPFQQSIVELSDQFNDRWIHHIYNPDGNTGKSTIAHLMRLFKKGLVIPPINDADKLVFSVCNMLRAKNIRKTVPMFIDLPRAMCQDRLYGIYNAIEQIKAGYVYDTRNHYKDWDFDTPNIFVFSNIEAETNMVSRDRWRLWTINEKYELVRFKAEAKPPVTPIESGGLAQLAQKETLYERVRYAKNI